MTPQEQELIQNVANKLKASPTKPNDADAERLINQEIGSQDNILYKLTQAVLVQEMALKELKSKSEFLEQQVTHYKTESERGALSRMMGGSNPPPVAPAPVQQPSAFSSFMQTAAGVAAGMVAGNLISNALFGDDDPVAAAAETATAAAETATEAAQETAAAVEETATAAVEETTAAAEEASSSFLGDSTGFASEFASSDTSSFSDSFASTDFGSDEGFGAFGSEEDFADFEEEDV